MKSLGLGQIVIVRYLDHVLFKDMDPSQQRPWVRESVGWLDFDDDEHIRLVWERFSQPNYPNESRPRATGLVIMKNAIVEMKRAG